MRKRFYYIILFIPLLHSCREIITVELDPTEDRVVIVSELSPNRGIDLDLSVTAGIFSPDGVQRPKDATIFLSGSDLPAEATAFIFSTSTNKYELRNKDFRPSPGEQYSITVIFPKSDFPDLTATTSIPEPVSLLRASVLSLDEVEINNGLVDITFDIQMELGQSMNNDTYLHVVPERVLSEYKIDNNGEVRVTFFAETEVLQVLNILDAPNAVIELTHKEGVFVDYAKLSDRMVKLRLSTTSLLDPSIDILQNIEVTVNTLSPELYEYHQNLHKQLINNTTSFTSPTSVYSNVENGIGIFGGLSSSNSLIKL